MILIAFPIIVFILGLLIGSFLNVVILRLNTGRSIVTGGSKCARCARPLAWYELIPVFSFLFLRGKCRTCNQHISFQYPLVELVTGILFVLLYSTILLPLGFTTAAFVSFIFSCVVASILVVITVYDFKHKIVPDTMVYAFMLLALGSIFYKFFTIPEFFLLGAIANGVLIALPFFLLWYFSNGKWMGFGDVKLALGIGWLLGINGGAAALLIAFWSGGLVGLFLLALSKKYSMKSEIPFGPFLIFGVLIAGIWGITLHSLMPLW